MDLFSQTYKGQGLPRLEAINTEQLWQSIPLEAVVGEFNQLDNYLNRHDAWTEKIRVMGLDGGILVNQKTIPALDSLIEYLYHQAGWVRPEIYVVADLGRKGIDSWTAVSVISETKPVILLGSDLVEKFDELEVAFVLGHETGHLLNYNSQWKKEISLSFLIRELYESNREDELNEISAHASWDIIYKRIMFNARSIESRCDLLGLLLCGDFFKASSALLSVTLKNRTLAQNIELENYLAIHVPLLSTSSAIGPISVNAGHPFMPYRINALAKFINDGELERFSKLFAY